MSAPGLLAQLAPLSTDGGNSRYAPSDGHSRFGASTPSRNWGPQDTPEMNELAGGRSSGVGIGFGSSGPDMTTPAVLRHAGRETGARASAHRGMSSNSRGRTAAQPPTAPPNRGGIPLVSLNDSAYMMTPLRIGNRDGADNQHRRRPFTNGGGGGGAAKLSITAAADNPNRLDMSSMDKSDFLGPSVSSLNHEWDVSSAAGQHSHNNSNIITRTPLSAITNANNSEIFPTDISGINPTNGAMNNMTIGDIRLDDTQSTLTGVNLSSFKPENPSCVTVFGFPSSQVSTIHNKFSLYGTINAIKCEENAIHITYDDPRWAIRAVHEDCTWVTSNHQNYLIAVKYTEQLNSCPNVSQYNSYSSLGDMDTDGLAASVGSEPESREQEPGLIQQLIYYVSQGW